LIENSNTFLDCVHHARLGVNEHFDRRFAFPIETAMCVSRPDPSKLVSDEFRLIGR
jgi:hypothetical protein